MSRGGLVAAGAYVLWGVLPLYWKSVDHVPAHEILCHRMVWTVCFGVAILGVRQRWTRLTRLAHDRRLLLTFLGSATLLSANWFVYIWAVNAERIVEASLGYFITPLVNVLLGVAFLRERLRPLQRIAVAVATIGVVSLTVVSGAAPWISLALAGTFGFYGLIRKTAPLGAIEGLTLESAFMTLPAAAYLLSARAAGNGAFGSDATTSALLIAAGPATAIPLILFAYGAQRVRMTTLGFLQYVAPTIQLVLGVALYREPFSIARWIGFSIIWTALSIYSFDGLRARRYA